MSSSTMTPRKLVACLCIYGSKVGLLAEVEVSECLLPASSLSSTLKVRQKSPSRLDGCLCHLFLFRFNKFLLSQIWMAAFDSLAGT